MSQTEHATVKVPASVWLARPRHIDELSEEVDALPQKVASGAAFLKVVAYPWGVEFDVCDAGDEP
jgi:hypothetical protein